MAVKKSLVESMGAAIAELPEVPQVNLLNISDIRLNGGTQFRKMNWDHIDFLKDGYEEGAKIPPVRVKFDGESYWLYDGFHRVEASKALQRKAIEAVVEAGTLRDARFAAAAANKEHLALPRTREETRQIIIALLKDQEWGEEGTWSNRLIAKHVGVSEGTVRKNRKLVREQIEQERRASSQASAKSTQEEPGRVVNTPEALPVSEPKKEYRIYERMGKVIRAEVKPRKSAIPQIAIAAAPTPTVATITAPVVEPPKPVLPELVPTLGDHWTLGRHHIYHGHSSDPEFKEMLPGKKAGLALVTIPYGYTQDWSFDWIMAKAELAVFLIQEADMVPDVVTRLYGRYRYAMFATLNQQQGWVGFFGADLPKDRDGQDIMFDEDANLASPNQLLGVLLTYYTKAGDSVIVIDGPSKGVFLPSVTCEELGRTCYRSHVSSTAIAREVQEFRRAFQTPVVSG